MKIGTCPICRFDEIEFEKHRKEMLSHGDVEYWNNYKPLPTKILSEWFVYCQNCGLMVGMSDTKDETIKAWNVLSSATDNRAKKNE